jgi:2-hydroxy-3-keto-5-methylthiopentenyl-1-phosphate phosphatase
MRNYSLFIDFDYTITTDDVGNRFYTYFSRGKNEPLVRKWLKREISTHECLNKEASLCRGTVDEFSAYIDKFEIDPGFRNLIALCRQEEIPHYILSDGLDFYINRILGRYDIEDVPIYCNVAEFSENGLQVSLPYWTANCASCGNCKGERIRKLKRENDIVIYIGDGLSDLCGTKEADIIFAKDDLAAFLREEGRDFIEYDNLNMVTDSLNKIFKTAQYKSVGQKG